MDRKSIIVLVASFALLGVWFWVVPILYPPIPKPPSPSPALPGTNDLEARTTTNASTSAPAARIEAPKPRVASSLSAAGPDVQGPEVLEKVETPDAVYTFTSHGGGLKLVELKKYAESVGFGSRRDQASKQMVQLNARARVPALALREDEALTGNGQFKLVRTSPTSIQAEQVLSNGLAVVKDFTITDHYLVKARLRLENRAAQPLILPEHSWTVGTASSVNPQDDPTLLGTMWYNGAKEESVTAPWFDNKGGMSCVTGGGPPRLTYTNGANNVLWAAAHNQFFTMALLAATNQVATQVVVRRIDLPLLPAVHGKTASPYGYEASLVYPGSVLPPGYALERNLTLYAGPKEYKTLSRLGNNLDVVMGYTGFFGWFAKALLLSMNGLYALVPNYGIVIILITVIIKLLFWPLTQASTRSMKRMQALQPQMKAIQEKYKDDPTKMNQKLMAFMKENKVSPMGGCLPMLLQIPVFIGFYQMIRSAIELRGVRFLWAADLSQPDTIAFLPGLDFPINPLPLIMGATMLWQAQMTPPTPGVDPMQQKIMKYMPMIFMVFLYNFSAGLTLYWTVQNLLTIAQMKLTKTQTGAPGHLPAASAPVLSKKKKQA
jgi:YidC/Oxa1 family membrane protein insertase